MGRNDGSPINSSFNVNGSNINYEDCSSSTRNQTLRHLWARLVLERSFSFSVGGLVATVPLLHGFQSNWVWFNLHIKCISLPCYVLRYCFTLPVICKNEALFKSGFPFPKRPGSDKTLFLRSIPFSSTPGCFNQSWGARLSSH